MSNTIKEIGSQLKARRNELGLTLDDVAKKSGVARSTIVKYERGVYGGTLSCMTAVAEVLGLKIELMDAA